MMKKFTKYDVISHENGSELDNQEIGDLYYTFDPKDSLAAIFFDDKICRYLAWYRHNRVVQLMFALFVAGSIWNCGMNGYETALFAAYIVIGAPVFSIPFQLAWLLSANKYAFKMVIGTFEFWVKVSQTTAYGALLMYIYWVHFISEFQIIENPPLSMAYTVVGALNSISVVALTSAFDAVPYIERKYQVVICCLICIIYLVASVYTAIYWIHGPMGDFSVIRVTPMLAFSLAGISMNMSRTISLFYAKQAVNLLMRIRESSNKAVSVKYAPIIEWKLDEQSPKKLRRRNSVQIDVVTQRLSLEMLPKCKEPIHKSIQFK